MTVKGQATIEFLDAAGNLTNPAVTGWPRLRSASTSSAGGEVASRASPPPYSAAMGSRGRRLR